MVNREEPATQRKWGTRRRRRPDSGTAQEPNSYFEKNEDDVCCVWQARAAHNLARSPTGQVKFRYSALPRSALHQLTHNFKGCSSQIVRKTVLGTSSIKMFSLPSTLIAALFFLAGNAEALRTTPRRLSSEPIATFYPQTSVTDHVSAHHHARNWRMLLRASIYPRAQSHSSPTDTTYFSFSSTTECHRSGPKGHGK